MNILTILRTFAELHQLRGHDHWTRRQLEDYQNRRLHELRDYAYQNSPFYQRFHQGLFDQPLERLPVLTKSMVMENFDSLVTDRAVHLEDVRAWMNSCPDSRYLGRYWISGTSGSSGKPGLFLYNPQEWISVMASFARGQNWAGISMNPFSSHRFAFILNPTSHHMTHRVGAHMDSPCTRLLYLSALNPLASLVDKLNACQPEVLGSYASKTGQLAQEQIASRLRIQPRWVFTSGERLTPEVRRLVEQAWGIHPFNDYAATETAVVAAECQQHNALHVYEDLLIVENVDEQNRPVPEGSYGAKLLVTVLFSQTQPLIRYELSDSVMMSDQPCACGRSFARIESIRGRQEETLHLRSDGGGMTVVPPLMLHSVMDRAELSSWQIIQRNDGLHVLVMGLTNETGQRALEDSLEGAFVAAGIRAPRLFIEPVEAIPRTASGKLTSIKCELNANPTISDGFVTRAGE